MSEAIVNVMAYYGGDENYVSVRKTPNFTIKYTRHLKTRMVDGVQKTTLEYALEITNKAGQTRSMAVNNLGWMRSAGLDVPIPDTEMKVFMFNEEISKNVTYAVMTLLTDMMVAIEDLASVIPDPRQNIPKHPGG